MTKQPGLLIRLAPAFALYFLAPLPAEYLIGYGDSTGDFPALFAGLLFFAPLYGGAALIIREVTRRTGRGWLTIILLAFAFGVFQASLVDQSLFNPSFIDIESWDEDLKNTYIPALGISGNNALNFIVGHAIWSIGTPILIVETCVPRRKITPWLGNKSLTVTIILYLLISALLCWGLAVDEDFFASPAQIIGSAAVVVAFISAAFIVKKRPQSVIDKPVPTPWLIGTMTLVLLSLVTIIEIVLSLLGIDAQFGISWGGTGIDAAVIILLAIQVWRWSQRKGWNDLHMLALAGGALLTRAWIAFLVEPFGDVTIRAKLIHNIVFALGTIALLSMAARTLRYARTERPVGKTLYKAR